MLMVPDPTTEAKHLANPEPRPYASQYVSCKTMKDGTEVRVRPIRPEDEPLMVKFHETLSDRTVYLRYFSSMSLDRRTTHERLLRICQGDSECEIVLVTEWNDPQTGQQHILGVGRLNKLLRKGDAEIAVLISDEYQRRGIGTELVRQLVQVARDEKLSRIVAEVRRDNLAIQITFKKHGFRLCLLRDLSSVQAVLDL
jgi:acetyltransferase